MTAPAAPAGSRHEALLHRDDETSLPGRTTVRVTTWR